MLILWNTHYETEWTNYAHVYTMINARCRNQTNSILRVRLV